MLFPLTQIDTNLRAIEEIPNTFFQNISVNDVFSYNLFPAWFQENYGNRQDGLYAKANELFQVVKNSGREEEIINGYWNIIETNQHCLNVNSVVFYCESISLELFESAKRYFHHLYKSLDSEWFNAYSNTDIIKYIVSFKRHNNVYLCPICGNEPIKSNKFEARAALDHWFCKAKYPFNSVSWNNLFPMGEGCNRPPVKGENELIWVQNERIDRQTFFYPFNWLGEIQINLICVEEPSMDNLGRGSWRFNFIGINDMHQDLVNKWNLFFRINDRWIEETLYEFIDNWTYSFANYLMLEIDVVDFDLRYNDNLNSFRNVRANFNTNPQNRIEWFFLNFLINDATPELFNAYKEMVREHINNAI